MVDVAQPPPARPAGGEHVMRARVGGGTAGRSGGGRASAAPSPCNATLSSLQSHFASQPRNKETSRQGGACMTAHTGPPAPGDDLLVHEQRAGQHQLVRRPRRRRRALHVGGEHGLRLQGGLRLRGQPLHRAGLLLHGLLLRVGLLRRRHVDADAAAGRRGRTLPTRLLRHALLHLLPLLGHGGTQRRLRRRRAALRLGLWRQRRRRPAWLPLACVPAGHANSCIPLRRTPGAAQRRGWAARAHARQRAQVLRRRQAANQPHFVLAVAVTRGMECWWREECAGEWRGAGPAKERW